jgi:DedD protein
LDDRLKERLTGAILLVVLVVVLVPAMFRGERSGAAGTASPASGPQSQVYTIDLKGAAPAAPTPAAANPPATLPYEVVPSAAEPSSAPLPAAVAPPAPLPSTSQPESRPVAPDPPRAAAARPADRAPVTAAARATGGGGFVVQVGSFTRQKNAAVMVRQAGGKGVRLTVAGPDDHGLFRVRSAVVRTRQEAIALQERLRAQGYRGVVGAVN